ncbi:MAG TPA: hypothetical protein VIM61_02300 [Chthoniobacterales bacterium]|jgi:hypothetical protein
MTSDAALLVRHVHNSGLAFSTARTRPASDTVHHHIGAVLVDTVLQAGLNYQTVVQPRVARIRWNYPEAATLNGFRGVINCLGAEEVLRWNHPEKPQRLILLVEFLCTELIDTSHDLINWLEEPYNAQRLQTVRGIGPKSVDYLKILLGLDAIAIDRHLRQFANDAGVHSKDYFVLRGVIEHAAMILKVNPSTLDVAIWSHMSVNS